MNQLHELAKSKPRGKETEVLLAEITRLESALTVARDDLVRLSGIIFDCETDELSLLRALARQS